MASPELSEGVLSNSVSSIRIDSNLVPTKRLKLPGQFFEFLGDVPVKNTGFYKCTFPNCIMKKDKDGCRITTPPKNLMMRLFGRRPVCRRKRNEKNCLKVYVLHLHSTEKPGFQQLVSRLVPNPKLHWPTFFTELLESKYIHCRQMLCCELAKTDASTTVDAWTSRRRIYLGETVH
uniref:Uncharacterized protein n=1 Tax=Daphnia galeata TaxID=27404 RepID=A0A8J2SDD4_9CRUS|nr:unnamed protein product [Daphnia galeata]